MAAPEFDAGSEIDRVAIERESAVDAFGGGAQCCHLTVRETDGVDGAGGQADEAVAVLAEGDFDLGSGEFVGGHEGQRGRVEHEETISCGGEHASVGGDGGGVVAGAGGGGGFEDLAAGSGVEGEEFGLLFDGSRAAAAEVAGAAEDKAAAGFPGEGDDALVGDHVTVVFDGPVEGGIPDAEGAAVLAVRGFAADPEPAFGTPDHGAGPEVTVADAAEGERVGTGRGPEFPAGLGGVVEVHDRASVVAEVETPFVGHHGVDLAAGHAAEVLAAVRSGVVPEDLKRHGGAAVHRAVRAVAHHEDPVAGPGVLERPAKGFPGFRILEGEPAPFEGGDLAAIAQFHR